MRVDTATSDAVAVEAVTIRRLHLPFVTPFVASYETLNERELLLLELRTDRGVGWGECLALDGPSYSYEFLDAALLVLERHALPRLLAADRITPEAVQSLLADITGHQTVKSAVEMAVLDASLRADERSFADYLGVEATEVPFGVTLGRADDLAELVEVARGHVERGVARIKLKIMPGFDIAPIERLRTELGPDVVLEADANGAYDLDAADIFRALDRFELGMLEQPLAPGRLTDHARLAAGLDTPLCLDESIVSLDAARQAIELGACRIVNIKPAQVGGYLEAVRIHDLCEEHGVPVWCGGYLETGLGLAANLALASLPNFTLPGDTIPPTRYFTADIVDEYQPIDGRLRVPTGIGLGVEPEPDRVAATTVATHHLSAATS